MLSSKNEVHDFWNEKACGEELYLCKQDLNGYRKQSRCRYELEPFIEPFARFHETNGRRVLEVGVGLGADHQCFAEAGAELYGIDLSERAVKHTRRRLELFGLPSDIQVGDAEALPFPDNSFDVIYSWGVMHHSPDTQRCVDEVYRVMREGGTACIMIYNKWSLVGIMLWLRYALLVGKPFTSLEEIYSKYLESPGTKAYTKSQAYDLFSRFDHVTIETVLTHGDLLTSDAGQRHRGLLLNIAKSIWPRWLIKRIFPKSGLFMLIKARK